MPEPRIKKAAKVSPRRVKKESRLAIVARLYCKGYTQQAISQETGVSQAMISRDIKALIEQWRADAAQSMDKHKARELAKINKLEQEYWHAWEKSCMEKTETAQKRKASKGQDLNEKSVKKTERDGDPRFLDGVERCIKLRCQILGLSSEASIKVKGEMQHTGLADMIRKAAAAETAGTEDDDDQPAAGSTTPGQLDPPGA